MNKMRIGIVGLLGMLSCILFLMSSCEQKNKYYLLEGSTMGTYYKIKYDGVQLFPKEIDSFLVRFNQSFSTYEPKSTISQFNQSIEGIELKDSSFALLYPYAESIANLTDGYFDYTVMPLVNAYGFGYAHQKTNNIDSILEFVGFEKVDFVDIEGKSWIVKEHANTELDFSAIAKGYAVDKIAELLDLKGINNYMIDIGGELRCKGVNDQSLVWKIGVDKPVKNATERIMAQVVFLPNMSIATSGNYRNFVEKEGKEFVHTVNPKTGLAFKNDLLSVSVVAKECYMADALATSMMAMGYQKADSFLRSNDYIQAYLIFQIGDTVNSKTYNGFEKLF